MRNLVAIVTLISLLSGCGWLKIYRLDIDQGNLIDQDKLAKVHIGMNKEQVRHLLGDPLLQDFFHTNRWDYVTLVQPANGAPRRHHVWFEFKQGQLVAVHRASPASPG